MQKKFFSPKQLTKDNGHDYMIKLIIIGDSGVGKTNILTRFCEDIFKDTHVATIGVDFNVKTIEVENKRLRLQVWDTAGQERFKTITQTYYKGAAGILLVYGVDSRESFESIERWMNQVQQRTPSSVKKILVGNKADIRDGRQVSYVEGKQMAEKFGLTYVQVSAKDDNNVDEVFYTISKQIKERLEEHTFSDLDNLSKTITLNGTLDLCIEEQEKKRICPC